MRGQTGRTQRTHVHVRLRQNASPTRHTRQGNALGLQDTAASLTGRGHVKGEAPLASCAAQPRPPAITQTFRRPQLDKTPSTPSAVSTASNKCQTAVSGVNQIAPPAGRRTAGSADTGSHFGQVRWSVINQVSHASVSQRISEQPTGASNGHTEPAR